MAPPAARAILIASGPWNPDEWAAAARAADPDRPVFVWPDVPNKAAVGYALAWSPPAGALASLPNLKAIFSLGAGVDHLVFQPDLPDVPIVRVVDDDLTGRMTEWVILQVLLHHRQWHTYQRQQAKRHWRELDQPPAGAVRVGFMGLGAIGRASATVLAQIGFRVAGWSRREQRFEGIETFAGLGLLDAFLARTDILVSLLPLTPETRRILSMPLFRKLARDGALGAPVLINAGRGGSQVEADIIAALDEGILGGASLDVFEVEPLPPTSRLWSHPNVVVTPHAAASSSPQALVPPMLKQIAAYEAGAPLENVIDRNAAY